MKQTKEKRAIIKQSVLRERHRRRRSLYVGIALVCLGLFVWLLSYLSRIPFFSIRGVEVKGALVIDEDDFRREIEEQLNTKYWHLFSKRNIFLYPKTHIDAMLRKDFPRLEDLHMGLTQENVLVMTVMERQGRYLWCGVKRPEMGDSKPDCYFADDHSYIFSPAPYFSDNLYLKIYGQLAQGNSASPIGALVLGDKEFSPIIRFHEMLERLGVESHTLVVSQNGDYEFILDSHGTNAMPRLIFKKETDYMKVAGNLGSALAAPPLKKDFKEKYGTLLYIDLRFPNKVLYKFSE